VPLASGVMDPAFIALGLLVGTLVGMTGVGAGSLVTPALTLSGVPPAVAIGTDLAYAAASKTVGACAHRYQRSLDLRLAGLLALGSVPAAVLTIAFLAVHGVHNSILNAALAFALVLTAIVLLVGRTRFQVFAARYEERINGVRAPLTITAGLLLGVLVSLSSVGAGALGAVMLVALYPQLSAASVAGTDIAHAVPLTLVAGLGHLWLGHVDFGLVANLLAGSVPGILVGSLLAGRAPDAVVRRVLACVLLYAGVRLGVAAV
jgi:uncharacterized membrane protein YfcA